MSTDNIYARVVDGKVVEYPVYLLHIQNRAHPLEWYTKVTFKPQPEVPEFFYLTEVLEVVNDLVIADYELMPVSLGQILYTLYNPQAEPGEPPIPVREVVPYNTIPPATVGRIVTLTKELVQKRLDDFAALKNYDGILSVCSYYGSTNAMFKAEGDIAVAARDNSWVALYTYLGKVQADISPVPKTIEEIEAELPVLTWNP